MTMSEKTSGTHDCGGDAAAYALGALEPAEAEAFQRHLEHCAVCRDELVAYEEVVHALPMAAPQHTAPKSLRRRVLRAIEDQPQAVAAPRSRRLGRLRPTFIWRSLILAGTCAAIALAVFAGLNYSSGGGTRVIPARVAGIAGTASVRLSGGRGELVVRHLSPPPPGKIYEMWLKRPRGAPVPTNVLFSVTSRGSGDIGLPPRLHGVTEILVTPEPKGGSSSPTHTPVIVAPLT
jgi:anti-sigma-K factor RskA